MGISFQLGRRRSSPSSSSSLQSGGKATGCVLFFFGIPFLGAGLAVLFFLTISPFLKSRDAVNWEPVEAVVTTSEVTVSRDSDGTTYNIKFAYTYTYGGQNYASDSYGFVSVGRGNRGPFDEIARNHPVGSTVTAYVNPKAPDQAVVDRTLQSDSLFMGLFGLVFVAAGGGIMVFGLFQFRRSNRASGTGPAQTQVTESGERYAQGTIPEPRVPDANGKVHLAPESTRLGAFLGMLFFALFWNGIVSVFVFQFIKGWRGGSPEIFLGIFLIPFVVIGVVMIGVAIYQFMALFNPKVNLWISPGRARPGQTFTVGWEFDGPVGRLEDFRLSLQGLERATYRQGTRTYTDEHLFHDHLIIETSERLGIASGQTEVSLPLEAQHSFDAPNNKIIWRFKLEGHIRRWPDLKCDYPFVLLPPPPSSNE